MFFNGVIFICNEVKERRSAEVYRDINVNLVERVLTDLNFVKIKLVFRNFSNRIYFVFLSFREFYLCFLITIAYI